MSVEDDRAHQDKARRNSPRLELPDDDSGIVILSRAPGGAPTSIDTSVAVHRPEPDRLRAAQASPRARNEELRSLGISVARQAPPRAFDETPKAPGRNLFDHTVDSRPSLLSRWLPPGRKDLMLFFGHLAIMYNAGLPLIRTLETLRAQTSHWRMKEVIEALRADVSAGSCIFDALKRHPDVFTPLHANFIRTGEISGTLHVVLRRLALYEERDLKLDLQVKSAVIYPAFVLACALLLVIALTQYLFTSIVPILVQSGIELPIVTRFLIFLSKLMQKPPVVLFAAVLLVLLVRRLWNLVKEPRYRKAVERAVSAVPILGATLKKVALARFCRAVGSLYASGVPLLEVLEVSAGACGSSLMESALADVRRDIVGGRSLSDSLGRSGLFPDALVSMIKVGEKSARLPRMLEKSGEYYEMEVQHALGQFAASLEPILILFVGLLVGFIIIAAFAPLYTLISRLNI